MNRNLKRVVEGSDWGKLKARFKLTVDLEPHAGLELVQEADGLAALVNLEAVLDGVVGIARRLRSDTETLRTVVPKGTCVPRKRE